MAGTKINWTFEQIHRLSDFDCLTNKLEDFLIFLTVLSSGSYFVLFVQFFVSVYFGDGKFAGLSKSKPKQVATDENDKHQGNVEENQRSTKKLE